MQRVCRSSYGGKWYKRTITLRAYTAYCSHNSFTSKFLTECSCLAIKIPASGQQYKIMENMIWKTPRLRFSDLYFWNTGIRLPWLRLWQSQLSIDLFLISMQRKTKSFIYQLQYKKYPWKTCSGKKKQHKLGFSSVSSRIIFLPPFPDVWKLLQISELHLM